MATSGLRHTNSRRAYQDLSDQCLIEAAVQGDEVAFSVLHDRHYLSVFASVRRSTGDSDLADDLTQEVFMKVHQHLRNFRPDALFTPWLNTIKGNKVSNVFRWRRTHHISSISNLEGHDQEDSRSIEFPSKALGPLERIINEEFEDRITAIIARLPSDQQTTILLRMNGKTYDEIAEMTGASLGTIKSRLYRARAAIAKEIKYTFGRRSA